MDLIKIDYKGNLGGYESIFIKKVANFVIQKGNYVV